MKWLDIFDYKDGFISWKINKGPAAMRGSVVSGSGDNRYITAMVDGVSHLAHRIVWEMHNGELLDGQCIDHINGIRNDNRIENLRVVTVAENNKNKRLDKRNKIGVHGVYWEKDRCKYKVSICDNGKWKHVGRFSTLSDAIEARKVAEKELGYHHNHGSELINE